MIKIKKITCENCGSINISNLNGYYVCNNCGTKHFLVTDDSLNDEILLQPVKSHIKSKDEFSFDKIKKIFGDMNLYVNKNRNKYSKKKYKGTE